MKVAEIKTIARNLGFDPSRMKKTELIRNIQAKEGNKTCYKMNIDYCDQYNCCWREDCKPGRLSLKKY
ncbi:MAG: SAP domain-containing protein [Spirochaetes bacterium]|nr:SAP domain-containing protein [Spirochaetota bacterium]